MPPAIIPQPAPSLIQRGFSLTELAIVLVVVSLLAGGMLLSLSAQTDVRNYSDARKELDEIKDALLGFAAANGRLPCPDTDSDPSAAGYGVEEASCNTSTTASGYLPWKTLGTYEFDPWGSHRSQNSDPDLGRWRYRVDSAFGTAITLTSVPADSLSVVDHNGTALTNSTTADRPVAIIFSTGPDGKASGRNGDANLTEYAADTPGQGFDDILIWISRPLLFNRLIAAGRLP